MSINKLKPVLVLIVSGALFAGFIYLADNELFSYVKTHFHNPSIIKTVVKENNKDAELIQNHIAELQNMFAAILNEPAVRNSFLHNQSAEDIFERSKLFGTMLESVTGLQSVKFVDNNGIRIHFSTAESDIIRQNSESTSFRNYTEDNRALPYDRLSVPPNGTAKFTVDDTYDRIIFSFPFFDSMDIYRGTALFSLSVRALAEKLIAEGRLKNNDNVSVIGMPPGVVFGSPASSKKDILGKVAEVWNSGVQGHITLDAEDSGVKLALISTKTVQNLFFGRLINDSVFFISGPMKTILKLSMFLTFYLTLFFLINLRPNPATLVRNRIKNLRSNLFEQLYVNKSSQDRAKWIMGLEQRRDDIRAELKYKLKLSHSLEKNIDGIIDKAWDELLAVIKSGSGVEVSDKSVDKPADKPAAKPVKAETVVKADTVKKAETPATAEALEEIEEMEEIEEIDEIEEANDVEELDEIEDDDDVEELDEIEEGEEEAEELEEIDEVEELDEVDEIEEIDSGHDTVHHNGGLLERASHIEKTEHTEEVEELEEIEELDELEELEELSEEDNAAKPAHPGGNGRGLLAAASKEESRSHEEAEKPQEPGHITHKGLLAMAREIEFSHEYPAGTDGEDEDLKAEVNIVSPFSSMFSSLDEEIEKE